MIQGPRPGPSQQAEQPPRPSEQYVQVASGIRPYTVQYEIFGLLTRSRALIGFALNIAENDTLY